jgi:hypothetical protein
MGWAHAIAHTADLFASLARSPHTDASGHIKILECIAGKLKDSTCWVYLYGEDSRLATSVLEIFVRGTLGVEQIKSWLASLSADWNNSWWDDRRARAFLNGRNFLRALHWKLLKADNVSDKEVILGMLRDTLDQINPFIPPE